MASRREKLDKSDPFARRKMPSLEELSASMLKPEDESPSEAVPSSDVDIFQVYPDRTQPRRSIPYTVRQSWDGTPTGVEDLIERWIDAYATEAGLDFDSAQRSVVNAVEGRTTRRAGDEDYTPGTVESWLFRVIDLAASIKAEGLVNPITVAQEPGGQYRIETGERRWLAYHLLHTLFNGDFRRIPARVVEQVNVWKQAYENNARDNLNAIGKARQFATLLMDLYRHEGHDFQPLDAFDDEQSYYAQIGDARRYDIPRGYAEVIITAMGVTNRSVTTRYRNLLKLPAPVWVAADDLDWTERKLRPLTAMKSRQALATAAQWAAQSNYVLPMGNIPSPPPAAKPDHQADLIATFERSKRAIGRRVKQVNRRQALALIEEYETWLAELKQGLDG